MTREDVEEGQRLIDELCWRFGPGTNNNPGTPSDPFATQRGGDDSEGSQNFADDAGDRPSHEEVGQALRDSVEYKGDDPDGWDIPDGESVEYHAVLRARERSDELVNTANWKLIRYAAALGKRDGLTKQHILRDLEDHGTPQYGYDARRSKRHVRGIFRKMDNDGFSPPSVQTLKERGVLPKDYIAIDELRTDDTLSGRQKWEAWSEARKRGDLDETSIIPTKALEYIAHDCDLYNFDVLPDDVQELPTKAHNYALAYVENEWWDPEDEKDTDATTRSYKSKHPAGARTWEDVRYLYEDSNKRGRKAAESVLEDRYHFISVSKWADSLHVYDADTGTYSASLADVRAEIHQGLEDNWSRREKDEILALLEQQNVVDPDELNGRQFDTPHVCVKNGVLDLFNKDLKDHGPEYYYLDRVPIPYDPDADTEPYEWFLGDVTGREQDAKAMVEMVGHALTPDAHERGWKKFMILYGDTNNGKSVFYDSVRALLNGPDASEDNAMGVKLQKISQNRFSKNAMYGRMANICGEVDGKKIMNTAAIKDITGGDLMEIEPKGGESFADTMNCSLMFAANDPPIIGQRDKEAIASRIVPIELPYTYTDNPDPDEPFEKEKIPESELADRLRTKEALSGLLKMALDGIERLRANNGDVSLEESERERLERYEGNADPMREFEKVCLMDHPDHWLVKADVLAIYKEFAMANDYELGTNIQSTLFDVLDYTSSQPRPPYYEGAELPLREWSDRKRVIDRVSLTEEGLKYANDAGLVQERDERGPKPITHTTAGMHPGPVTATVAEQMDDPPEWLQGKGYFVDGDGGIMPYLVEAGSPLAHVDEGDEIRLEKVKVENRDGVLTAVLSGITDVATADPTDPLDGQAEIPSETATDGGGDIVNPRQALLEHLRTNYGKGDMVNVPALAGETGLEPTTVTNGLETIATEETLLAEKGGGQYEVLE